MDINVKWFIVCYFLLLCIRVHDEKDARNYLQSLSKKMAEELDTIKSAGAARVGIF